MSKFYAIKNQAGMRRFFEWQSCDTFDSRESLELAIAEWKKAVTPRMASQATFEVYEEAE